MKVILIVFATLFIFFETANASEQATCHFLPESTAPNWVNNTNKDNDFYYAVGGTSGKKGSEYLEINNFINQARQDAINNLASSIRSAIKVSTKRTVVSKKDGKSKAEIRKEVNQKTEVVSQAALSAVIDDARWLDRENCLLWYQVKVSKKGAEFAVKAYVNEVAEKLNKKIEQLTHREIEQILSDNGFSMNIPDALRALINNNSAIYRGQSYNIAELYNQSDFDWLNVIADQSYAYAGHHMAITSPAFSTRVYWYSKHNIPATIVRSNSDLKKQVNALKQLQAFNVDLNQVRLGTGTQLFLEGGKYNLSLGMGFHQSNYLDKNGNILWEKRQAKIANQIKSPFIYNFNPVNGEEKLGLLHIAIASKRSDLIEPLINLGVDINQKSQLGYTALAFAIEQGQLMTAQYLLSLGADPKINDYLAYKIAYLIGHLNNPNLYSPGITFQYSNTINTLELVQTIEKMKLSDKTTRKLSNNIKQQFAIEVKVMTIKKGEQGRYRENDSTTTVKKVFINGEKIK